MMTRQPIVAGQFYPAGKDTLEEQLEDMIPDVSDKTDAMGAVSPHAGYMYSGSTAGEVYARLIPKDTYIIISPNHTGYGSRFSASSEPWSTPLGTVDIDRELLSAIMDETGLLKEDPAAHAFEHSVEVQIPFIQKTAPGAKIIPMTLSFGNIDEYRELAGAVVSGAKKLGRKVMVIASSDMTHYESRVSAAEKDRKAIQKVLDLDPEGLLEVVEKNDISMCGYIPTAIMLMCANKMGAKKAELIKYTDSGEATGDTEQVVGYAGIIVS
jgi:AmmeMemoRadiSam system protein B